MNKDIFETNWKQIRGHISTPWSLVNDFDLLKIDKADIKLDKLVTMLQVKYGYTRDQAKKEITRHLAEFESVPKVSARPA